MFWFAEAKPRRKFLGMPPREEPVPAIVGRTYDFVLWLLPKVDNFPREHRFTVGERLTANGLDLLTTLVEAAYSKDKLELLQQANRKINSTRYLLRLAKDMRLMSIESWWFSVEKLGEIGRMVGGWQKAATRFSETQARNSRPVQ